MVHIKIWYTLWIFCTWQVLCVNCPKITFKKSLYVYGYVHFALS